MEKVKKPAGRKPKDPADKVVSKGVYLTSREWRAIEKQFGSGTAAMRAIVLPGVKIK